MRIESVANALSALALISDGAAADPYLQSIHHAVLRLMVQRMEANYGEFDQTFRAALHAWPHCLLTRNLATEAPFLSASAEQVGADWLVTGGRNVNWTGRGLRMMSRYTFSFSFFFWTVYLDVSDKLLNRPYSGSNDLSAFKNTRAFSVPYPRISADDCIHASVWINDGTLQLSKDHQIGCRMTFALHASQ